MDTISVVSLVIGVTSLVTSIAFFWLGSKSENRSRDLLNTINSAIQTWQSKIMESSIELLNAQPEIVGKQLMLEEAKAKTQLLESLANQIEHIIRNPSQTNGPQQSHHLELLLKQTLQNFCDKNKSIKPKANKKINLDGK